MTIDIDTNAHVKTATADIATLLNARTGGNGRTFNGTGTPGSGTTAPEVFDSHRTGEHVTTKRRWATGPQIEDGVCLAVLRAEAAAFLRRAKKLTLVEAARYTGSNPLYVSAWEMLEQYGDAQLMSNVRAGDISPEKAAAWVKPLVDLKAAFKAAKDINPVGAIDFFKSSEVKDFITVAGVVTVGEHIKAVVDTFGIDGTLEILVRLDAMKLQSKEIGGNGHE